MHIDRRIRRCMRQEDQQQNSDADSQRAAHLRAPSRLAIKLVGPHLRTGEDNSSQRDPHRVYRSCIWQNTRFEIHSPGIDDLEPTELKDLTSTSFGYVIAFLLPGLICLYGLSFWFKEVPAILQPTSNPESSLGPSLVFLLLALAIGLFVSAGRWLLYEKFLCKDKCFAPQHFQRLRTPDQLTAFKAVVDEHYRYHQFFGGMTLAIVPGFGAWVRFHYSSCWRLALACAATIALEALLIKAGVDSYCKYIDRANDIAANP